MAKDVLLKMEGITKAFPGVKALDNVSLEVKAGTVHALIYGSSNGGSNGVLSRIQTMFLVIYTNIYLICIDNYIYIYICIGSF